MNTIDEIYTAIRHSRGVVVLDFDGVVADTEPLHEDAYVTLLEGKYGIDRSSFDFSQYVGNSEEQIYCKVERNYGIRMDHTRDKRERLAHVMELVRGTSLGPSSIVTFLIGKGVRPLYILSSQDASFIDHLLMHWGIRNECEILEYRNKYSNKLNAIRHLNELTNSLPKRIFHFEDSPAAIEVSRAIGCRTVYVRNSLNREKKAEADWTIDI